MGRPGGEDDPFERLCREHGSRIYTFCRRLAGNRADAEDLAQEVFLAAFRGLPGFQGRSSAATWLYRIALRCWSRLRSAQRREPVSLEAESGPVPAAGDWTGAELDRIALQQALERLPEAQREAFILVMAEGLKYREAAAVLGIPQGTVHTRVHQAVLRLRALLSEAEDTAPEAPTEPAGCPGGVR